MCASRFTKRNDEESAKAIDLYRAGYSFGEIAELLSRTRISIYRATVRRGFLTDAARLDNKQNGESRLAARKRDALEKQNSIRGHSLREERESKRRLLLQEMGLPTDLSYRQLHILLLLSKHGAMTVPQIMEETGIKRLSGRHTSSKKAGKSASYLGDMQQRGLVAYIYCATGNHRERGLYMLTLSTIDTLGAYYAERKRDAGKSGGV